MHRETRHHESRPLLLRTLDRKPFCSLSQDNVGAKEFSNTERIETNSSQLEKNTPAYGIFKRTEPRKRCVTKTVRKLISELALTYV